MRRRTGALAAGLMAVTIVLALGVGFLGVIKRSEATEGAIEPLTASVERRTLRETVVVRGSVTRQKTAVIRAVSEGRVTASPLVAGATVEPGTAVLETDGRPTVAVPGTLPFWRDLGQGDRGRDVAQLQGILAEAGFPVGRADGTFGGGTEAALKSWQAHHGLPTDGVLRLPDMAVGTWPARVGSTEVAAGDFVGRGDAVATLTDAQPTITVPLTGHDRVLVSAGQEVGVTVPGTHGPVAARIATVSDVPQSSPSGDGDGDEQYPATVVLEEHLDLVEGAPVRVEIVIAEAPDALAVPLAALALDGSGDAVVQVLDGTVVRQAPVETGMVDGAYIQVSSGLEEGDLVILEAGA